MRNLNGGLEIDGVGLGLGLGVGVRRELLRWEGWFC